MELSNLQIKDAPKAHVPEARTASSAPKSHIPDDRAVSFVNNYVLKKEEIRITVNNPIVKLEKKIKLAFEAFDKYLPLLGILKGVFELIRTDLYDGIYSELKTSQDFNLQRIPYFVTCKRLSSNRDEVADDLRKQIEKMQQTVVIREDDLKACEEKISKLNGEIGTLTKNLLKQKQIIQDRSLENQRQNESITQLKNKIAKTNLDNDTLKEQANLEQDHLRQIIEGLESYKSSYDKLDVEFQNKNPMKVKTKLLKKPAHVSLSENEMKQLEVSQNIESVNGLKSQLFTLRNRIVTEYDNHLNERKKKFLYVQKRKSIFNEENWESKDQESVQETKALLVLKKNFLNSIQKVQKEIALLDEQKSSMGYQLSELKKASERAKASSTLAMTKQGRDVASENQNGSNAAKEKHEHDDLVKIMEGEVENPFIPHQEVFNKFSIMIFTSSNDGKHYTEIPGCTYCSSCHEKTIVCLHKVSTDEKIINLPSKCTNIKITRPRLKLHTKLIQRKNKQLLAVNENLNFAEKVWPWFHSVFPKDPKVARTLKQEELLNLIHEFFAYLLCNDDVKSIEEAAPDLLCSLVNFLKERYNENEVVGLVMFDILFHTEKYSKESKEIELFGKNCSSLIDSSIYRYMLLIADVINYQYYEKVEEIESFLKAIYPFSTDDEVEVLKIGFISFSENRINRRLVFRYILHLVMTGKEPRVLEITTSLHSQTVRTAGYINDIELSEAIESMTPFYSERLRKRLFTVAMDTSNRVTTHTAACICAYLIMCNLSRKLINEPEATKNIPQMQNDVNNDFFMEYNFLKSFREKWHMQNSSI